ncbi:EAL domain-containing protein [Pseudoalteromonas sp. S2755]|uniref:EAL domain-containing protein n=1 Tax=Pseudoalteromonas sp. S2755 TaxID=2066523 RepID=UPI00110BC3DD|nr:EAL domain-containing protein [Pseudoalteromonas sp. S2755]TMN38672.1 EAL domain-containing protein [Pseudoalteromonas sp. S2755]
MWCADCEAIESYFFETTYFWFFLPTGNAEQNLLQMCTEMALDPELVANRCIMVQVHKDGLSTFLHNIGGCLAGPEFGQSKMTTMAQEGQPDINAISRVASVETFVRRYQARWIKTAIENETYQSWFQPIVRAYSEPGNLDVFANEALFRLFDDENNMVPPNLVFNLAEQSGLLFSVDLIARKSAVEHAAKANLNSKIFINFNPSSIYDPSYCLRSTASAISELGFQPQDIVFEVTETHQARDVNHLRGILAFYRSCGFGVALDDIGSGWSSLNMLAQLRPDYIKIDMDLVRHIDINQHKRSIVSHLIQLAHENGIEVIAEGVESQHEAKVLREIGADFLQGYYFAKPSALSARLSNNLEDEITQGVKSLSNAAHKFDTL